MQYVKQHKKIVLTLLTAVSIAAYYCFAYTTERTDFTKLLSLYSILFVAFYSLVNGFKENFKLLAGLSILFRLVLLVAIPALSQDFYRFIWDGRLLLENFNVYLFTPKSFIEAGNYPIAQAQQLFDGMGSLSAGNHTNYPPLNQLVFAVAGLFAGQSILGSVVVMRLIIILADIGTLWFGSKLLKQLNISKHYIFYYVLNPFIILELTGNLHFEAVMLFFIVLSLYLVQNNKWKWAAVALAFSVSIKLIPLIFLPLFYKKLGAKNWVIFCSIVVGVVAFTFVPFLSMEFVRHYTDTVALWFQKFEFNASIYYLFREVGYAFRGYNEIAIIGKILSAAVILFVLVSAFLKRNITMHGLMLSMLFVLAFYFFTTTTMHPWYLATPLLLSVFSHYRFTMVWSFTIFLSYFSYSNSLYQENTWLLLLEYGVVYLVLFYEVYREYITNKKRTIPV